MIARMRTGLVSGCTRPSTQARKCCLQLVSVKPVVGSVVGEYMRSKMQKRKVGYRSGKALG